MLAVRSDHLRRLQHIYTERHVANLEAIGVQVRLQAQKSNGFS